MKKFFISCLMIVFVHFLYTKEEILSIINLESNEWHVYKDLRLRSLQECPTAFGGSYEEESCFADNQWKNYLQDSLGPDGTIFLFARLNNNIVGMAGARIEKTLKKHHVATIFSVYVTPEARGKKIARRLLEAVITELKYRSIAKVQLVVNTQQKAAFALYRRMGFHIAGFLEKELYVENRFHDFYLMTKFLDE